MSVTFHEQAKRDGLGSTRSCRRRNVKHLIEADAASSDADFLSTMGIALREAKESRAELAKIRMGQLDHHALTEARGLESEASQLSAIFATIILKMRLRLDEDKRSKQRKL